MALQAEDKQVKKLLDHAKSQRKVHEDEMREAYDLTYPARPFNEAERNTSPNRERIYDNTATHSVRNLVNNTVSLLIPQKQQWVRLKYRDNDMEKRLAGRFDDRMRTVNNKLHRHFTDSNFYLTATEALYDSIIAGTMCVMFQDQEDQPLSYLRIPLDEIYFLEDYQGRVDVVFREHTMTGRQLLDRFGNDIPSDERRDIDEQPEKKHKIIESVVPDGARYSWEVRFAERHKLIQRDTLNLNPFIVSRWEKSTGAVWGESPVRAALPSIRTVNSIVRDILAYGQYASLGLWQVNDETVNTEILKGNLEAGSVVAIDEPLQPVPFPGSFTLTFEMADQERAHIKKMLLDASMPREDVMKYATAEAITAMREQFFQQVGEPAQRLQREFLQPIADQTATRLQQRGELSAFSPEEVQQLFGSGVRQSDIFRVDVNAAVERANQLREATDAINGLARTMQVLGPQQTALHVDMDKLTRLLLEGFGLPDDVVRSEAQVEEVKQELKAQMAQLQQDSLLQAQSGEPGIQNPQQRGT